MIQQVDYDPTVGILLVIHTPELPPGVEVIFFSKFDPGRQVTYSHSNFSTDEF